MSRLLLPFKAFGWAYRKVEPYGWIVAILFVCIGMYVVWHQGKEIRGLVNARHTDRVAADRREAQERSNSSINRAINVERWCEGEGDTSASLNKIVRYDKSFVAGIESRAGVHLHYRLQPNDCEAIIIATLRSGTEKESVTPASHPLVYAAIHRPR